MRFLSLQRFNALSHLMYGVVVLTDFLTLMYVHQHDFFFGHNCSQSCDPEVIRTDSS